MRHFFWYRIDGSLGGYESYKNGFPLEANLADPSCKNPIAVQVRSARQQASPDFTGFLLYDCPCAPSVGSCGCCATMQPGHYADGSRLVPKPALTVLVDGAPTVTSREQPMLKVPYTSFRVRLSASGVPNGTQVVVRGGDGPSMVPSYPIVFTMNNGVSNEVMMVTPPHGALSVVAFFHQRWLPLVRFCVRGWSA